ncbi:hypothetical protein BHE74_00011646 [Ensete ventricosum]|nr:hypothetical protein GW17_00009250 [Ensete ventricosum]RWW80046.1 hypothetical protein BHE74_00011646 [Ensete ventricosum]RZR86785.1 hypothetical protein BHM03_00014040 [Ensete ventricosum]
MERRRSTSSGEGTIPGPPLAKTSLHVSNSLCTADGIGPSFFCSLLLFFDDCRLFTDADLLADTSCAVCSANFPPTLIKQLSLYQKEKTSPQTPPPDEIRDHT